MIFVEVNNNKLLRSTKQRNRTSKKLQNLVRIRKKIGWICTIMVRNKMKSVQMKIKMVRICTKVRIRIKLSGTENNSSLLKVTCAGFNITWKRSAFLSRQQPSSIPSSQAEREKKLKIQYVIPKNLKGLPHEMDLAFDDMLGQFQA